MSEEEQICRSCGENIADEIYICFECGNDICDMCSETCPVCHEYFCSDCFSGHKKSCR